jgi:hypothetical protein
VALRSALRATRPGAGTARKGETMNRQALDDARRQWPFWYLSLNVIWRVLYGWIAIVFVTVAAVLLGIALFPAVQTIGIGWLVWAFAVAVFGCRKTLTRS